MWDFAKDMRLWNQIALEAHARHSRDDNSTYVRALSVVEAEAHRHVAKLTAAHKRVMELGVGGGEHLAFAPDTKKHEFYAGVDISFPFAEICRRKFDISVTVADIAALPFSAASFDCAIAMHLLEHVEALDRALGEISRVLEPGGTLYAVVPTNGSIVVGLFKIAMTYPTMRARGIARPDLVWNYLNVNPFRRIQALLHSHFDVIKETSLPIAGLPWHLSPLWMFRCVRRS
jgi:SAM-dependent methyltransferase